MKKCSTCKQLKSVSDFHSNKSRKDGLAQNCRTCSKNFNQKYRKKNADYLRDKAREYRYGVTAEEVDAMYLAQDEKCAICKRVFTSKNDTLVDHCHKTLRVRGLLCKLCNSGIGYFGDNIQVLKNAIGYLEPYAK